MTKRLQGIIYVFIATALWGVGGVWIRFFPHLDSISLVFVRTVIGAIFFCIVALVTQKQLFEKIKTGNKKTIILNSIYSLGTVIFYTLAIKSGSVASAAFLLYTIPLFVITLYTFFASKKPINGWMSIAITFSAIGVFAIFIANLGNTIVLGTIWGLFAGLSWGLQLLESRNLGASYPTILGIALMQVLATVLLIPFTHIASLTATSNIVSLILYAVMVSIIAPLAFYQGIISVTPTDSGIISLFDPIIASLAALFILGEIPTLGIIIGGIFIIVGNIIQIFSPEATLPEIIHEDLILKDLFVARYKQGTIGIRELKAEQTFGFKMLFLYFIKVKDAFGETIAKELLQQMAIERRKAWYEMVIQEKPRQETQSKQDYVVELMLTYWKEVTPYDMTKELIITKEENKVTITHASWSPIRDAATTLGLDVDNLDDIMGTNPDIWMANQIVPGTDITDYMVNETTGNLVITFPPITSDTP